MSILSACPIMLALVCVAVSATAADGPVILSDNLRFDAKGTEKVFAMTYDDGPLPDSAPPLLEALAKAGWKATFCVYGERTAAHPELVKRMIAEGHEVASHSWDHPDFTKLTPAQVDDQLKRTEDAIVAATGKKPTLFRPPYTALTAEQGKRIFATYGYAILNVSFDSHDWQTPPVGAITKRMLEGGIRNGEIVLAHESFPQSVKEMPDIIAALAAKGWRSVTVSQLRELKAASAAKH